MTPLSLTLYRWGTGLLSPMAPRLLRQRAERGKEDPDRLRERLGYADALRPDGPLIWLHGASVGESLSLLALIEGLRTQRPGVAVLVTSGTVTSAELMARRLPKGVIHQYAPVDTPGAARRFVQHWKPQLTVFVESEIWPNLILAAKAGGSKLALLSARFSPKSLHNWRRLPGAARTLFGAFDLVLAQDHATASALHRLGARNDGGLNLKRYGAPLPVDAKVLKSLKMALKKRPMLLAASTHPGEDEIVLGAFTDAKIDALLVIVPRHPARAEDIVTLVDDAGLTPCLRSQGDPPSCDVYIADTLGELGLWFSLARTAFIGGSLLPGPGGHNPVEAAQLGCPVISGPHVDNWREIYADLINADAVEIVPDAAALTMAFKRAIADPSGASGQAERARHVVAADEGALSFALERLISLLS